MGVSVLSGYGVRRKGEKGGLERKRWRAKKERRTRDVEAANLFSGRRARTDNGMRVCPYILCFSIGNCDNKDGLSR